MKKILIIFLTLLSGSLSMSDENANTCARTIEFPKEEDRLKLKDNIGYSTSIDYRNGSRYATWRLRREVTCPENNKQIQKPTWICYKTLELSQRMKSNEELPQEIESGKIFTLKKLGASKGNIYYLSEEKNNSLDQGWGSFLKVKFRLRFKCSISAETVDPFNPNTAFFDLPCTNSDFNVFFENLTLKNCRENKSNDPTGPHPEVYRPEPAENPSTID